MTESAAMKLENNWVMERFVSVYKCFPIDDICKFRRQSYHAKSEMLIAILLVNDTPYSQLDNTFFLKEKTKYCKKWIISDDCFGVYTYRYTPVSTPLMKIILGWNLTGRLRTT